MPRSLPPFLVKDRDLTPFERYLVAAYGEQAATAIFGQEEVERLWRRHFPGESPAAKAKKS